MAYAEASDVEDQWRTLSESETTRATALLDMAGILLERHVELVGLPENAPNLRVAKQVSIDMVIEALAVDVRGGVSSYQVELDDAIESATYREGSVTSTIVFTHAMRALFGLSAGEQTPMGYFGDCPL